MKSCHMFKCMFNLQKFQTSGTIEFLVCYYMSKLSALLIKLLLLVRNIFAKYIGISLANHGLLSINIFMETSSKKPKYVYKNYK